MLFVYVNITFSDSRAYTDADEYKQQQKTTYARLLSDWVIQCSRKRKKIDTVLRKMYSRIWFESGGNSLSNELCKSKIKNTQRSDCMDREEMSY